MVYDMQSYVKQL